MQHCMHAYAYSLLSLLKKFAICFILFQRHTDKHTHHDSRLSTYMFYNSISSSESSTTDERMKKRKLALKRKKKIQKCMIYNLRHIYISGLMHTGKQFK